MGTAATLVMQETATRTRHLPLAPDVEIVERCLAGEPAAYRELYRTHRSAVYGVVARMITNDADREELVQDIFLQVFRSLPNFRQAAKLSTWVHRVAVNVTLQHIRRKGRRVRLHLKPELPDRAAIDQSSAEPLTPETEVLRRERRSAVERALQALPEKKRAALVLADFQGMSSKQIAQIVGAPALTVRTRLFYARKAFYAKLSKDPAFADLDLQGVNR
jgi:RNA polymerase sigma-70 factor (ECF subfamily)